MGETKQSHSAYPATELSIPHTEGGNVLPSVTSSAPGRPWTGAAGETQQSHWPTPHIRPPSVQYSHTEGARFSLRDPFYFPDRYLPFLRDGGGKVRLEHELARLEVLRC